MSQFLILFLWVFCECMCVLQHLNIFLVLFSLDSYPICLFSLILVCFPLLYFILIILIIIFLDATYKNKGRWLRPSA